MKFCYNSKVMDNSYIVRLDSVRKTFHTGTFRKRKTEALRGIDLSIKEGEIFGILGPNGAGKTTMLNIIVSLLKADSGEVRVMGKNVTFRSDPEIRRLMNMCSGNPNFIWCMTVRETLKFYALLYGVKNAESAIRENIDLLELNDYADVRFDELSTGTKQRLAMAKSLINHPRILLLDEPTLGLDPDIARKTRALIKRLHEGRGITILLTTHYMREAEELCGRIAFIKKGRIMALGTSRELMELTKKEDLEEVFIELAHQ